MLANANTAGGAAAQAAVDALQTALGAPAAATANVLASIASAVGGRWTLPLDQSAAGLTLAVHC